MSSAEIFTQHAKAVLMGGPLHMAFGKEKKNTHIQKTKQNRILVCIWTDRQEQTVDTPECSISSVSTLFATHPAIFRPNNEQ